MTAPVNVDGELAAAKADVARAKALLYANPDANWQNTAAMLAGLADTQTVLIAALEAANARLQGIVDAQAEKLAAADDPVEYFAYGNRNWDAYELSVLRYLDTGAASREEMEHLFSSQSMYEHLLDNGYIGHLRNWVGFEITPSGEKLLAAWRASIHAFWQRRFEAGLATAPASQPDADGQAGDAL